jgi:hypothetical protein
MAYRFGNIILRLYQNFFAQSPLTMFFQKMFVPTITRLLVGMKATAKMLALVRV